MQAVNEGVTYKSIQHSPQYRNNGGGSGAGSGAASVAGRDGSRGGDSRQSQLHQRSGSGTAAPNRAVDPRLDRQQSSRVQQDPLGHSTGSGPTSSSGVSHGRTGSYSAREPSPSAANAFNTFQLHSSLPASTSSRAKSPGMTTVFGNYGQQSQQTQGQPQGILKPRQGSTNPDADNQRRVGNQAGIQAARDRLAGQRVKMNGLDKPIKSYKKTMDTLRYDAVEDAFEVKEATTYEADETAMARIRPTHLAVYFPMRQLRKEVHDPKECAHLCRGQPHVDRGPVCRFCREKIGRPNRDEMIFYPNAALEHLAGPCKLPYEERKILLDAFQDVDREALGYHTGTQQVPYSRIVAASARQPSEPRKRNVSNTQNRPRTTNTGVRTAAGPARPIAAKQSISTAPRVPNSAEVQRLRQIRQKAERAKVRLEYEQEAEGKEQSGWGVRAGDARYDAYTMPDEQQDLDELAAESADPFIYRKVPPKQGGHFDGTYKDGRPSNGRESPLQASSASSSSRIASTSAIPLEDLPQEAGANVEDERTLGDNSLDTIVENEPSFTRDDTFDSQATENQEFAIMPPPLATAANGSATLSPPQIHRAISESASLDLLQSVRESAPGPRLAHLDRSKPVSFEVPAIQANNLAVGDQHLIGEKKKKKKKKKNKEGKDKKEKKEKKEKHNLNGIRPMPMPGLDDLPPEQDRVLASIDFKAAVPGTSHATGKSASSTSGTLFRPPSPVAEASISGEVKVESPTSPQKGDALSGEPEANQDIHELLEEMIAKQEPAGGEERERRETTRSPSVEQVEETTVKHKKGKGKERIEITRSPSVERLDVPQNAMADEVVLISDDSDEEQEDVGRARSVSSDFGDVPLDELFSDTHSNAEEQSRANAKTASQTTRRKVVVENNEESEESDSDEDRPLKQSVQSSKVKKGKQDQEEHVSESSSQAEIRSVAASSSGDEDEDLPSIPLKQTKQTAKNTAMPQTQKKNARKRQASPAASSAAASFSDFSASENEGRGRNVRKQVRQSSSGTGSGTGSGSSSGSDSDSDSDDAIYVQASWDPKKVRNPPKPTITRRQPASRSESKDNSDSASGEESEQEVRRPTKPTKPSATARSKQVSTKASPGKTKASVPTKKSSKPGAAARKTGRPMQPIKKAGPTPPNKSPAKKQQNDRKRQRSVSSDDGSSSASSSSSDSDDGMVADSPEFTDVDTEEEEELRKRAQLKRKRLRTSTVEARSSPVKASQQWKRRRVEESSEEEPESDKEEEDGEEGSEDELAIRPSQKTKQTGKTKPLSPEEKKRKRQLVRARDLDEGERRKRQKMSISVAGPSNAGRSAAVSRSATPEPVEGSSSSGPRARLSPLYASAGPVKIVDDDFPPVLDDYRVILLKNKVKSMAELSHAVRNPKKALNFVDYLAEGSTEVGLQTKPLRFAFGQAIEAALTGDD